MKTDNKISLVIPVRNEEQSIGALLESISAQTRLPDEIVFVDAGSTDKTASIIEDSRGGKMNIALISIGAAYPGTARNAGAEKAGHDLIAFTDAGIELDKDWLKELAESIMRDPAVDVVYGDYAPKTDTLFKRCLAIAIVPPRRIVEGVSIRPRFLASSLMKKDVWQGVGRFPDFRAAEDRIFMERIEKGGYGSRRNPKATVKWDIPRDINSVFNRFCSYSYHDLKAGRTSDWHLPVLKMYVAALMCVLTGLLVSPLFFLLPIFGLMLRVARKITINRSEPYFKAAQIPAYLFASGFLIFLIDMAMFSGWVKHLLSCGVNSAKLSGRDSV